jgi:hypothetical protein
MCCRYGSELGGYGVFIFGNSRKLTPRRSLCFALRNQIRKLRLPGTNAAGVLAATGHASRRRRHQRSHKDYGTLAA